MIRRDLYNRILSEVDDESLVMLLGLFARTVMLGNSESFPDISEKILPIIQRACKEERHLIVSACLETLAAVAIRTDENKRLTLTAVPDAIKWIQDCKAQSHSLVSCWKFLSTVANLKEAKVCLSEVGVLQLLVDELEPKKDRTDVLIGDPHIDNKARRRFAFSCMHSMCEMPESRLWLRQRLTSLLEVGEDHGVESHAVSKLHWDP